jgi:hypothetical protein
MSGGLRTDIHGGEQNVEAKPVNSSLAPNVNLVLDSFDRNSGTILRPTTQPLNNFNLTKGSNILQGQFNSIKVQEINFPWSIPNIVKGKTDSLAIETTQDIGTYYQLTIPEGFYTGTQLADALNVQINATTIPVKPSFAYLPNGSFEFSCADDTVNLAIVPVVNGIVVVAGSGVYPPLNSCTLTTIMGYSEVYYPYSALISIAQPVNTLVSGFAPLLYTSYVDICSDSLTQFQGAGDVSTAIISKQNVICRMYVADETSTPTVDASGNPVYPGMAPFIIHRQFKNAKVMRWNGQNSVGTIDIQLYDQWGQLLEVGNAVGVTKYYSALNSVKAFACGDFQLTLSATQQ